MRTIISNGNPIAATKIGMFPKTIGTVFPILVAAILGAAPAAAANYIVVVRVGDGVQPMTSGVGNSLFLDEFTTSGIYLGTVTIPSSGTNALIADASTTQQSPELWTSLRLSTTGQYLIFPGFNVSYPSSQGLSSANASVVPRGIGRVDANGVYTMAVSDSGLYNAATFRSVVSSDGFSQFWTSGGARGVKYLNPPNPDVQVSPVSGAPGGGNVRDLGIFNGVLYASTQASTNYGLYIFDGVPIGADNPSFLLGYNPTNSHPDEFAVSPDGQTIYLADDGVNGVSGGIERWDFNGFGWNVSYILSTGDILGSTPVGARGLAVDFSNFTGGGTNGVGAVIYATTAELTGNRLISIADYGPASSASTLSVINTTNQVYRGVSFWPTSSATNSCLTLNCRNLLVYACTCTNVAFTNAVNYSDPCCSNNVTLLYDYPITNCFQVNTTNTINVVAYDNCGNVVSNSFTVTVLPYSVTVVVPAGSQSLLCNPLNNGNNAANILFPNPDPGQDYTGPRDFDELEVYQCPTNGQSVGTFELFIFDSVTSDTPTGFLDANDNPVPAPILNPGCGFIYLDQQGVNETNVFTGCPGTPGACICGCNQWSFLGPVGLAPTGSYQGITGSAPVNGSQVSFSPPGSGGTIDIFSNGVWSPATPVVTNGEAAFFFIPCCLTLTNIVNGTNRIYSCGTTNWAFDYPQPVDLCCSNPVVTFTPSVLSTCPLVLQGLWIAHDACSNFVEYQETLTIPCCGTNVCMQIGSLTNKTVPCGTNWSFDRPVVLSDVCCTNHQYIYSMQVITNSGSCPQMLTAVWQIFDACGNTVNCTQTVTVACCTNTNCVTPPANMVLWLPFDETNGNISANLQSPLNPGTQVNNPTPWQGQFVDNSLNFSGTNYVTVSDYPAIDIGSNDMTIDAWVYQSGPASANPTNIIVSKVSSLYSGAGYALMLETNKGLIFDMNGHFYNENAPILPSGYWHFVAVTLNQSIQLGVFYVDGNAVGYFNPAPPASLSNTDPLWVASAPGAFSVPFNNYGVTSWQGALDEVEIYNRALSTNELNSIFNAGPAGKCKPCISILCTNLTVYTCTNCTTVPFNATATDRCCTNPIVFYNYTTNTCFEVNTTNLVIVMASDDCGHTATNSFTITVLPGNCGTNCLGPNLVPNAGFEEYTSCPSGSSQLAVAAPWFSPSQSTPDYFNACAISGVGVPLNFAGYRTAHGGNGYAGGWMRNDDDPYGTVTGVGVPYREYIEVPLIAPLVAGHTYTISFYTCLASNESNCGLDNLGAYLSPNQLNGSYYANLPVTPQVRNPAGNFLTSFNNWVLIQGNYTAAGGESYLTIGNFYDDAGSPAVHVAGGAPTDTNLLSYYYFDDVSVEENYCATSPCPNINFTDFTSNAVINASMYLNGSAAPAIGAEGTPVLRLTSASSFQAGSAFVPVMLANNLSFSTEFSFQMTNGGGSLDGTPNPAGADGICFVMASAPTDVGLLGFAGGGVGYQNISSSSVAIKFDSWEDGSSGFPQDSDPNGNFVAVYTDGSVETAGYVPYALSNPATQPQYYPPPHSMKDGDIWYAWINYNGTSGEMDVYLSDGSSVRPATPQLVQTISLDNLSILGPSPELYVGFTAATGGAWEDNDVLSWQFASPCTNACLTILCSNIVAHTCASCTNVQFAAGYTDLCCSNATLYYNYPSNYCFQANTTNTVQVIGIDNCGNTATNYFTVTVVPCQESNCLTMSLLTSNLVVYSCSGCAPITFSNGVAYDPGFLANVVAYSDPCCSNVSIAYFPSNYCFAVGSSTPVQVTVYDSCGNMEWQQFNVTVLPGNCQTNCLSSSCPSNVVVTLPCGSSCVTLSNYPPAFATNYCDPTNLTVVYYPPLPNCFPPGDTTVYRWVYGSGQSNYCTFDVIVQTNSCSSTNSCIKLNCTNLVAYTCSTNCLIVPLTATAVDTCCTNGYVSLQYYVLAGTNYYDISPTNTCFPVNTTNTVVVVGTDSCGDTATKSFTVTVLNGPGALAIKYQQLGNDVVLTWSQGILQAMPATLSPADPRTLMYPWSDVPGATSPCVTKASGATTFYRLRCPCMTCTNCLVLNCPTNITVITCAPCTNIPFASYVGVQDNCCTNWNLLFNYPTNFCFPVNTTNTIQVLAMDSCGVVATNSFTVTVLPCANGVTNCLALDCPGNITVGTCSSTATVNASASIFGCTNGVSLLYVALSGYSSSLSAFPFPVGTTEVTVLANQGGNTVATCYFYVTVTNLNCNGSGPMIQWTFAGSQPNAALAAGVVLSNIAPELGTGTASALHHGAAAYSSPDGNGSDHSFSANNWTVGDYFQFSCSAANATDIGVAWDQVSSSTGPGLFQLQYSTDGSTFNNAGAPYSVAANNSLSGPSSYWTSSTNNSTAHYEQDLSSISSLANAAQVSFRLVDVSSNTPFGATVGQYGASRVGNFTVTGVQLVGQVPEVTWAAPGPIMYGTPLGDEQLDAMSTVAGTFTYSPPAGTILPVGSNLLTAVFTGGPGPHTNTVILVVMPRPLTFSGDNTTLTAGQTNTAFTGTILGALAGDNINATWTCTATPSSPPGDYPINPIVTANPGALLNYIITTNPGTGTMPPVGCTCHGVTNLLWTFEVSRPHADEPAGVPITGIFPEFGSGVASALHQAAAVYTHPIGDGSTNSFCATNWNVGDYFQFACSNVTLCFNWEVSWDQVSSYTGPGQFQLRYSLDGVNFINIGAPYTIYPNGNLPGSPAYWTAAIPNPWTHYVQNLTIVSPEPGTPTVWFQLVDVSETSADGKAVYSAGSDRVDNFRLTSTDTGP